MPVNVAGDTWASGKCHEGDKGGRAVGNIEDIVDSGSNKLVGGEREEDEIVAADDLDGLTVRNEEGVVKRFVVVEEGLVASEMLGAARVKESVLRSRGDRSGESGSSD